MLVLGSVALLGYILFLMGENVALFKYPSFADLSVYLLFVVFLAGYYFLWRNLLWAGLIWIVWHAIQWCLVMWVWPDGAMTLIIGFPIFLLGIVLLIFGLVDRTHKKRSRGMNKQESP